MAKFDPVIQEHVRRIKNNETPQKIRQQIVEEIKEAKYFSILMDCTPDISREEQLSIIIHILDMRNKSMSTIPCIKEYFIEFINVHSTTGYDLTNILLDKLNRIGIDLKDCRGQAYDNGANMKGQYKGVQSRIIAKNPRAFFSPCACHNLNLLLGDIAKSSTVAVGFFGTIQRIYCLFASSIKRWDILKKHCTFLTLKPLSETRWECKVNSIKTIRYQVPELFRALEEVAYTTSDPKTKSEAQSLASNELESYEFILSLVIYNLLNGLLEFLKSFRMNGFESSKIKANEIVDIMNINKIFKKKRLRKTKKQFDYENSDEINDDPEKNFRTFYFNVIADGALSSFSERFNQFQIYNNNFSFLYNISELQKITNDDLMKNCLNLQNYLSDGDSYDIVASELYEELLVFRHTMKEDSTPIGALSFLKTMPGSFTAFLNIVISLRILLTIPITSASA
ncbi:zinc finger MYM-type protein 1-like [Sipha flava]|uniref:Zinc finger MYM-type protein 1-like n=1 Tax=Sipha flava TaxID=143950 RepID=A0A8B8F9L5_9HEMI|nr:zinc finger MYM-type protein 1-like [Sipha flava]